MIALNTIFSSLQGEGPFQGYNTLFVRLHGCNLRCSWCDTAESQSGDAPQTVSTSELIALMGQNSAKHLCITGGEPLLQEDELTTMLTAISQNYTTISIETNGTLPITKMAYRVPKALFSVDLKPPSSGHNIFDTDNYKLLAQRGWLKIIANDEDDLAWIERQLDYLATLKCEIFISPVAQNGDEWYKTVAHWIMKHGNKAPLRMQLQLHKQIGLL
ncbi:radical SAM protein [bacterium]|nr:radical SAM protein [bacterium]